MDTELTGEMELGAAGPIMPGVCQAVISPPVRMQSRVDVGLVR